MKKLWVFFVIFVAAGTITGCSKKTANMSEVTQKEAAVAEFAEPLLPESLENEGITDYYVILKTTSFQPSSSHQYVVQYNIQNNEDGAVSRYGYLIQVKRDTSCELLSEGENVTHEALLDSEDVYLINSYTAESPQQHP